MAFEGVFIVVNMNMVVNLVEDSVPKLTTCVAHMKD